MKYAINVQAIHAGNFNLEGASFEVNWEAAEIKDMLTHILPFVKTMVDTVTEKVVPLVREIEASDREYHDAKELARDEAEAAEKEMQRAHELIRDEASRVHEIARIKAAQEHDVRMHNLRSGNAE